MDEPKTERSVIETEKPSNAVILFNRRHELHMTQQQVADKAGLQLRQYQRLEKGERDIINASCKVILPICEALRLNPYIFLGEAETEPEEKRIVVPPALKEDAGDFIPCTAYYFLVGCVPRGMVCTWSKVYGRLREAYGKGNLEIRFDFDFAEIHNKDRYPHWRIVGDNGILLDNLLCSKERQMKMLESEGVAITTNDAGRTYQVEDFEFVEYDLKNVRITVAKWLRPETHL